MFEGVILGYFYLIIYKSFYLPKVTTFGKSSHLIFLYMIVGCRNSLLNPYMHAQRILYVIIGLMLKKQLRAGCTEFCYLFTETRMTVTHSSVVFHV